MSEPKQTTTPEEQAAEVPGLIERLLPLDFERHKRDRRALAAKIAAELAPLFAEERRKGAEAGWDEGYSAGFGDGAGAAYRKPTTRNVNPYRERADTYAEGDCDE